METRSAVLVDVDGSSRVVIVPVSRFGDAPALLIDPATQDGSVADGGWLIVLDSGSDQPIYRRTRGPLAPGVSQRQSPPVQRPLAAAARARPAAIA